jgi:hypothetical protein
MKVELKDIWLKAAVAGGLWASFEILVGSFLHNLHLPFSGTVMATLSVVLMIAFLQVWNTSGLIWRAGIVSGLMKSLSPSAMILGPMTGIMMEAVLMDLMIFLLGKNLVGYWFAGITALLSTILHKIINLFILYGSDLVNIYVNLFRFLMKQLSIEEADPRDLILWILILYTLLGMVAATTGYLLGRHSLRSSGTDSNLRQMPESEPIQWELTATDQRFRLSLFFLHLLMIPGMMLLINRFGLHLVSLVPSLAYIVFLVLYYKKIFRRLKKPLFWSQLVIVTLAAGLFWHPPNEGQTGNWSGFLVGIEMSLRAVLIVSAFSALSVEIRNPRIIQRLFRLGFRNAYAAISVAFQSLPAMLDRSADLKSFLRRPVYSFTSMIQQAGAWLESYRSQFRSNL